jgi:3-oxoacyl-[acyl-carrier-protein] synthase-3
MAILHFKTAKLAGIACSHPAHRLTTDELALKLDVQARRIQMMTGIEERRIAPAGMCASDLCADAAERLLADLFWEKHSVDGIVFVSQTPDYILPATACTLQDRLGLSPRTMCFDINLGCSGYVYGLSVAMALIESGLERVLLLVGDTSLRISEQDRSVAFLFGDSGTATAIERKPQKTTFVLGTDGSGSGNLIVPGGQARNPCHAGSLERGEDDSGNHRSELDVRMNGAEVMAFTLREIPQLYDEILAQSGVIGEELDYVVMHQANQFILDRLADKMGIPREKVPSSLRCYGNTSCASIPVTLSTAIGSHLSNKSNQMVMMGFGVGWSWAACAGIFAPMHVSEDKNLP